MDSLNRSFTPTFNPRVAMLSAVLLTGVAAFSGSLIIPLLIVSASFALITFARSQVVVWAKITLIALIWSAVISSPLLFTYPGEAQLHAHLGVLSLSISRDGVNVASLFILRVASAAAIFASLTLTLGWRGIIVGLKGLYVPRELIALLGVSIVQIPLFMRDALRMLLAREARVMKRFGVKSVWQVLSTVVGDLLIIGLARSSRVDKAIRARVFSSGGLLPHAASTNAITGRDLLLLAFTLSVLLLWLS